MTDTPIVEETQEQLNPAKVMFLNREIGVIAPTADQLAILRRMADTFTEASKVENMAAERAVKLLSRALSVVLAIIPDEDDRDFIEDKILMGEAKLDEALPLVTRAIDQIKEANPEVMNRAERRAAERKTALVVE